MGNNTLSQLKRIYSYSVLCTLSSDSVHCSPCFYTVFSGIELNDRPVGRRRVKCEAGESLGHSNIKQLSSQGVVQQHL
jgi:hypothetical protein